MLQVSLLLTLLAGLSLTGGTLGLDLTKDWQNVVKSTDITLPPSLPYTFQVKADWGGNPDADDLVITLRSTINDDVNVEFELNARKFKTTACQSSSPQDVQIPDSGVGDWNFEMSTSEVKVSLNGKEVVSITNECMLGYVSPAKWIQFSGRDDVSRQFRLLPEPCTGFPSDWQSVEPMTSGTTTPSGTSVNVVCTDSRANKGSTEVTCKIGEEWTFEVKPDCVYQCTGFDESEFPNMFIPALPAYEGEELEVQCYGGTVQLGSDTVTCNKGTEFTFNIKPECSRPGKT
ncbi:hypothetical protein ACHWQZ_G013668 [Mnemiopsis leidyi]